MIDWQGKDKKTMTRWWIYQKERFPLFAHGALIASFSFCAAAYSARLRADVWPDLKAFGVAFISCFIFFLQLRIADEFKDHQEDCQYRPYRPVPRGLVSLKELAVLFIIGALIQFTLAYLFERKLIFILLFAWAYLASMSFEFGFREWLKQRPIIYLLSHMLIMPIVDFYATSCEWIHHESRPPQGIIYFLMASFFNGIVIEFGRKIRAPEDEETGVETYSFLWGPKRAAICWLFMIMLTMTFAVLAGYKVGIALHLLSIYALLLIPIFFLIQSFCQNPQVKTSKTIELTSGLWTLILYLSLGVIPGIL